MTRLAAYAATNLDDVSNVRKAGGDRYVSVEHVR